MKAWAVDDVRSKHYMSPSGATDITEGVKALYDLVINSMNWGSGFLTYEDAAPVAEIARLFGFEGAEEVQKYVDDKKHAEETKEFIDKIAPITLGHIHMFHDSLVCDWPLCNVRSDSDLYKQYNAERQRSQDIRDGKVVDHDHVFSSVGKCMWPRCKETNV